MQGERLSMAWQYDGVAEAMGTSRRSVASSGLSAAQAGKPVP